MKGLGGGVDGRRRNISNNRLVTTLAAAFSSSPSSSSFLPAAASSSSSSSSPQAPHRHQGHNAHARSRSAPPSSTPRDVFQQMQLQQQMPLPQPQPNQHHRNGAGQERQQHQRHPHQERAFGGFAAIVAVGTGGGGGGGGSRLNSPLFGGGVVAGAGGGSSGMSISISGRRSSSGSIPSASIFPHHQQQHTNPLQYFPVAGTNFALSQQPNSPLISKTNPNPPAVAAAAAPAAAFADAAAAAAPAVAGSSSSFSPPSFHSHPPEEPPHQHPMNPYSSTASIDSIVGSRDGQTAGQPSAAADERPFATFSLNDPHVHLPPYAEDDDEFLDHSSVFVTGILQVNLPIQPPRLTTQPTTLPRSRRNSADTDVSSWSSKTIQRSRALKAAGPSLRPASLRPCSLTIDIQGIASSGGGGGGGGGSGGSSSTKFFSSFSETLWELKPEVRSKAGALGGGGSNVGGGGSGGGADREHIAANLEVFENNLLFAKALDSGLTSLSFPFRIELPATLPSSLMTDQYSRQRGGMDSSAGDPAEVNRILNLAFGELPYRATKDYSFPRYEIQCTLSFHDPSSSAAPTGMIVPIAQTIASKPLQVYRTLPSSWIDPGVFASFSGSASNGFAYEVFSPIFQPFPQPNEKSELMFHLRISSSRPEEVFKVLSLELRPLVKYRSLTAKKPKKDSEATPIDASTHVKTADVLKSTHHMTVKMPFLPRNPSTILEDWVLEHAVEVIVVYRDKGSVVTRRTKLTFPIEVVHVWREANRTCDAELAEVFQGMKVPERYTRLRKEVPYAFVVDATPVGADVPGSLNGSAGAGTDETASRSSSNLETAVAGAAAPVGYEGYGTKPPPHSRSGSTSGLFGRSFSLKRKGSKKNVKPAPSAPSSESTQQQGSPMWKPGPMESPGNSTIMQAGTSNGWTTAQPQQTAPNGQAQEFAAPPGIKQTASAPGNFFQDPLQHQFAPQQQPYQPVQEPPQPFPSRTPQQIFQQMQGPPHGPMGAFPHPQQHQTPQSGPQPIFMQSSSRTPQQDFQQMQLFSQMSFGGRKKKQQQQQQQQQAEAEEAFQVQAYQRSWSGNNQPPVAAPGSKTPQQQFQGMQSNSIELQRQQQEMQMQMQMQQQLMQQPQQPMQQQLQTHMPQQPMQQQLQMQMQQQQLQTQMHQQQQLQIQMQRQQQQIQQQMQMQQLQSMPLRTPQQLFQSMDAPQMHQAHRDQQGGIFSQAGRGPGQPYSQDPNSLELQNGLVQNGQTAPGPGSLLGPQHSISQQAGSRTPQGGFQSMLLQQHPQMPMTTQEPHTQQHQERKTPQLGFPAMNPLPPPSYPLPPTPQGPPNQHPSQANLSRSASFSNQRVPHSSPPVFQQMSLPTKTPPSSFAQMQQQLPPQQLQPAQMPKQQFEQHSSTPSSLLWQGAGTPDSLVQDTRSSSGSGEGLPAPTTPLMSLMQSMGTAPAVPGLPSAVTAGLQFDASRSGSINSMSSMSSFNSANPQQPHGQSQPQQHREARPISAYQPGFKLAPASYYPPIVPTPSQQQQPLQPQQTQSQQQSEQHQQVALSSILSPRADPNALRYFTPQIKSREFSAQPPPSSNVHQPQQQSQQPLQPPQQQQHHHQPHQSGAQQNRPVLDLGLPPPYESSHHATELQPWQMKGGSGSGFILPPSMRNPAVSAAIAASSAAGGDGGSGASGAPSSAPVGARWAALDNVSSSSTSPADSSSSAPAALPLRFHPGTSAAAAAAATATTAAVGAGSLPASPSSASSSTSATSSSAAATREWGAYPVTATVASVVATAAAAAASADHSGEDAAADGADGEGRRPVAPKRTVSYRASQGYDRRGMLERFREMEKEREKKGNQQQQQQQQEQQQKVE
ncbi:hypothetical protein DFJ73DRAFT_963620 [Zopfochytrium polystomum]|nr:hypothetical protein DFJ73DRAFT_963620 [Zopfochytrium polystomum]